MIQFALIGCGRIAERHVPQIKRLGRLAATCDINPEKAATLAQGSDARVYTHIDDLLEQEPGVNVVVVCTPNGLHAEHSIKSLQARKHVLCEKPMCLSASAAWTMRDTAHFFRRKLFVVKQNRFNPPVQAVKNLLDQNGLGRILSFSLNGFWSRPQEYYTGDWRGTADLDGGILYTQFSHFIDLLLWLLGDVQDISALQANYGLRHHFEIEDTSLALLHMATGAVGTLHFSINSIAGNKEGSLTLIGEKGSVKIGGQYLNTVEWSSNESGMELETTEHQPANDYGFYTGSMSNHHLVYDELEKALSGQPHTLPQIQEAVRTVETIERIYAASNCISVS